MGVLEGRRAPTPPQKKKRFEKHRPKGKDDEYQANTFV